MIYLPQSQLRAFLPFHHQSPILLVAFVSSWDSCSYLISLRLALTLAILLFYAYAEATGRKISRYFVLFLIINYLNSLNINNAQFNIKYQKFHNKSR